MAYLRWGAPLNFDAGLATGETDPVNAFVAWTAKSREERQADLKRQGASASEWYIYWDAASDNSLGRNGQLLAVWHAGSADLPLIDYQELRRIADRDAWKLIPGYSPDQDALNRQALQNAVREFLSEVEDEYPPTPPQSRRELAEHFRQTMQQQAQAGASSALTNYLRQANIAARIKELAQRAAADADPETDSIAALADQARATALAAEQRAAG